jgi:hypothetical protein
MKITFAGGNLERLGAKAARFRAGKNMAVSNTSHVAAGMIVERLIRMSVLDFLHR